MNYFEERERALLGQRFDAYYQAPQIQAARGVTVNGLRCTPQQFAQLDTQLELEPSPFCSQAFVVRQQEFKPGRHPYHHGGAFYSQEPSASAPAALLQVEPGMKVLDLCAAPGGKSSQLAAALQGKGLLVSNEYMPARAEILRSNLERMGVANALILNGDTKAIGAALPGFFDRVLVDAPCSGEGMFRKEPQAVTQHNEGLVEQCAQLGREILEQAAQLLAPGGLLMYSTCTFAPQEDEGQVGAFLARHPEFSLVSLPQELGSPGEENRCMGNPFPVEKVRRIWPFQGGEGHFMALLQKQPDAPGKTSYKEEKPTKPCKEWQSFAGEYFPQLAQLPVIKAGEQWLLMPQGLPQLPAKLRVMRAGVALGTAQKNRFVPAHHLFMAFGNQCVNQENLTLSDPRTAAWLRGEEIPAQTAQKGWCSVLVDGFPLGAGKVSGGVIKNHYPKALRNLK
ncbi:RsmB/NOP family class I SAM-dependent RNA methyltransferase [uncultured Allofournierella sp.]|uniref:RsmB/NOP family class I SAM-dependent RNA methyltransferase n=1 Tax=uncultured Allofournierella sp. TaxID=1940258 RepID=UPI0037504383